MIEVAVLLCWGLSTGASTFQDEGRSPTGGRLYRPTGFGAILIATEAAMTMALFRSSNVSLTSRPYSAYDPQKHVSESDQAFSWEDYGVMTPVKTDGRAICWDYSAMASFEANWGIRHSRDKVVGNELVTLADCNTARLENDTPDDALNRFTIVGVLPQQAESMSFLWPHGPYGAFLYTPLQSPAATDLRTLILDHGPLAVYIDGQGLKAYRRGRTEITDNLHGEPHYVIVCGWDDSKCRPKGGWRIKNSFGTDWADNGYAWVKYGIRRLGDSAFWCETSLDASAAMRPTSMHPQHTLRPGPD